MESLTDYYKYAYTGGMGGQSFYDPGIKNRKSSPSPSPSPVKRKFIGKTGPIYGVDESRVPMQIAPKAKSNEHYNI